MPRSLTWRCIIPVAFLLLIGGAFSAVMSKDRPRDGAVPFSGPFAGAEVLFVPTSFMDDSMLGNGRTTEDTIHTITNPGLTPVTICGIYIVPGAGVGPGLPPPTLFNGVNGTINPGGGIRFNISTTGVTPGDVNAIQTNPGPVQIVVVWQGASLHVRSKMLWVKNGGAPDEDFGTSVIMTRSR